MFGNAESTDGGGMLFLFFIGLIIVWSIMFNGGGSFLGGNGTAATGVVANDMIAKIDNIQSWINQSTIATMTNNNNQTNELLANINASRKDSADIYISNLRDKNVEQANKISQLESQLYLDGKFAGLALENCAIRNQLTAIQGAMIKQPEFIPFGGTPEISCSNIPRRGCEC